MVMGLFRRLVSPEIPTAELPFADLPIATVIEELLLLSSGALFVIVIELYCELVTALIPDSSLAKGARVYDVPPEVVSVCTLRKPLLVMLIVLLDVFVIALIPVALE